MMVGSEVLPVGGDSAIWITVVGEAAAKGTLLLLAAGLVSLALRRAPAATRHMVWASCLALLLALPLLAQLAPVVPAPAIPVSWSVAWEEAVDAAGSRLAALLGERDSALQSAASLSIVGPLEVDRASANATTTVSLEATLKESGASWAPTTWLAGIWLGGVMLVLSWLAVGLGLRRLLANQASIVRNGPWVDSARRVAAQLGIRRDLVLLRGQEDAVPMTWGTLRPVIYLSPGADDWPAELRRTVLLHELAHVKRWDSLTRTISQIACAVFWFHPLAWYAAHRLLREQERACDDVVLLAGAEPDEYAATLLTLARRYRYRRPAVVGALAFARRTTLENRLISILDPRRKRFTMSRTNRVVLLATFVAFAVPLASLQSAPAEPAILSTQSSVAVADGGEESIQESTPVQMIIKGEVHLGPSLEEIEVGPGGRFIIQEIEAVDDHLELDATDPEIGRRLEITADTDGSVERKWTVNGVTSAIDDSDREWINGILGRLDDAHVELKPFGEGESRSLIFAGESLALISEAHTSAGASGHAVIAYSDGESVIHIKPGMVWRTRQGEEGQTLTLKLAKPVEGEEGEIVELQLAEALELEEGEIVELQLAEALELEEGTIIDLHLAEPIQVEEGGEWTIHIDEADLLHGAELGESIVVELKKALGDESFTIETSELELVGEGDERKVIVVVPKKGHVDDQELSTIVVSPKIKISEEAGEARAVVVVEPEIVAEVKVHPRVHVEIVGEDEKDHRTIVVERADDERHRHSMRMHSKEQDGGYLDLSTRGEVELGGTVDEIEIGEGGELTIDARDADGVIRQLSVRRGADGELIFEFHVDGEERPFDAAARTWLQGILDRIEG
jgi:beta-lactamase regulating signal transducer with metallopeptidase domain